jgi:TRAP-type mannitol/chloroaromatic compound transport system permease small subunit
MNIILFALPFINAKRFNMAVAILNFSWTIRNYLVLSACSMGECPTKQWSIYACIVISFAILIMTFLPKIDVNKK